MSAAWAGVPASRMVAATAQAMRVLHIRLMRTIIKPRVPPVGLEPTSMAHRFAAVPAPDLYRLGREPSLAVFKTDAYAISP